MTRGPLPERDGGAPAPKTAARQAATTGRTPRRPARDRGRPPPLAPRDPGLLSSRQRGTPRIPHVPVGSRQETGGQPRRPSPEPAVRSPPSQGGASRADRNVACGGAPLCSGRGQVWPAGKRRNGPSASIACSLHRSNCAFGAPVGCGQSRFRRQYVLPAAVPPPPPVSANGRCEGGEHYFCR
jgi:hypothetical protein